MLAHAEKNRVLHERLLLVSVHFEPVPYVDAKERSSVERLADDVDAVSLHFGFMEEPRVVAALRDAAEKFGLPYAETATYYVGRETILAGPGGGMGVVSESIFAFMQRNALTADRAFGLPPTQVVEIGSELDL